MPKITLGKTGLVIEKNAFGCLPIQRVSTEQAGRLLLKAYDNGINFFDTARLYTDSEQKMGLAFKGIKRDSLVIAGKSHAATPQELLMDLDTSLQNLQTDYLDIFQFHNPSFCPLPGGADGLFDAALKAQQQGKIRFIGISSHKYTVADQAIACGFYDTLQYPLSYLSQEREVDLAVSSLEANMGFIAMKALAGGLITSSYAAAAFLQVYPHLTPIWGIQEQWQLDEFISYVKNYPCLDKQAMAVIAKDRRELATDFCRGCGYCLPCPEDIDIPNLARMSLLLRRAPAAEYTTAAWQDKMRLVDNCRDCNHCLDNCPYELDVKRLLKENYRDFWQFV